MELPKPIKDLDLDRARADLAETGLALLEGALTAEETRAARERLFAAAREDRERGRGYTYDQGEANQRVWVLLNRGPEFVDLVQRPFAIELVEHLLGRPLLLSNFSANITGPGGGPGPLHADQLYLPLPWPPYPVAANAAWLLTDFTARNGATLVAPGSHQWERAPAPGEPCEQLRPLEAPAGTAVLLDGRTWHRTGPNGSPDEHRVGLFAYYVRPYLRTQEVWHVSLDPEVRAAATPLLRELIGEQQFVTLGGVNGQPLDGPRF